MNDERSLADIVAHNEERLELLKQLLAQYEKKESNGEKR